MKSRQFIIISMITAWVWLIPGSARSGNDNDRPAENSSGSETTIIAPVTPMEAGFDEETPSASAGNNTFMKMLAPITPVEATFYDETNIKTDISPVTPKEADFDEGI